MNPLAASERVREEFDFRCRVGSRCRPFHRGFELGVVSALIQCGLLDCFCVENCDVGAREVGCGGSHGDHRGGLNFDAFLRC